MVVSGRIDGSLLTLEVADDGCGGADRRWGSGLQGLTDRLSTLDGSLTVASPRSGGTQLRAESRARDPRGRRRAVREERRVLQDAGFDVVGQAGGATELLARSPRAAGRGRHRHPHAAGAHDRGLDAAAALRRTHPSVGLLLLSNVETHSAVRLAAEFEGGVGYLLKERVSDLAGFAADIRRVAGGECVIDAEPSASSWRRSGSGIPSVGSPIASAPSSTSWPEAAPAGRWHVSCT